MLGRITALATIQMHGEKTILRLNEMLTEAVSSDE